MELSSRAYKIGEIILYSFVVGFIILVLFFAKFGEFEWAVAFGSVAIATISVNLGIRSKKIAVDTANATFLGVVSDIEDKRIEIQHFPGWRRINVWKSFVHMNQAKELLDFCNIMPRHQTRLNNVYNHLLELLDVGFLTYLHCEEVAHLLRMYQIASNLQSANDSREDTNTLMRVLFDEEDTDEINIDVVNILLGKIKDFDNDELFILVRDEIKNYIVTED
jgi:hypothetical protein